MEKKSEKLFLNQIYYLKLSMYNWPVKETNELYDKSFEFDWLKGKIFR